MDVLDLDLNVLELGRDALELDIDVLELGPVTSWNWTCASWNRT